MLKKSVEINKELKLKSYKFHEKISNRKENIALKHVNT